MKLFDSLQHNWQSYFNRLAYFFAALLLHLVALLLLATYVVFKAPPMEVDQDSFSHSSVQLRPPPPAPPPPSGGESLNDFEPTDQSRPPLSIPSVVTTISSSTFTMSAPKIAAVSLPGAMSSSAIGTGLSGHGTSGESVGAGSPFGSPYNSGPSQLVGYLFDLKQTTDGKPTGMTPKTYHQVLTKFVAADWAPGILNDYYKANKALNTSSIFVPTIRAVDGPAAFGVENEVAPKMYVVWYKATASPPVDGTYRFAGLADDILVVRVNGETVLDASLRAVKSELYSQEKRCPVSNYRTTNNAQLGGLFIGSPMNLTAGVPIQLDILIGEEPGGYSNYFLYIEREDAVYGKQANGSPEWPIFQLDSKAIHPQGNPDFYPPFSREMVPWQTANQETLP